MPGFELIVRTSDQTQRRQAIAALPRRFPEISLIEQRPPRGGTEVWICRAPTASHIERWVREAHIEMRTMRAIELPHPPPASRPVDEPDSEPPEPPDGVSQS